MLNPQRNLTEINRALMIRKVTLEEQSEGGAQCFCGNEKIETQGDAEENST